MGSYHHENLTGGRRNALMTKPSISSSEAGGVTHA